MRSSVRLVRSILNSTSQRPTESLRGVFRFSTSSMSSSAARRNGIEIPARKFSRRSITARGSITATPASWATSSPLWEPNRHLNIPRLAQAYALTGDPRYAAPIRSHVESWIEQCPCGRGANWSSSLELAIRLINWSLAWQWLGGYESRLFAERDGAAFRDRWLTSVYQHARAIVRRLSRFSSANNHLIGEAAGVWIASITWDCWPEMRSWGLRCKQILLDEMFAQNAKDGGNRDAPRAAEGRVAARARRPQRLGFWRTALFHLRYFATTRG